MAKEEKMVITVPGTNFTNPPKSKNKKYPKSAKPPQMAAKNIAFLLPFQMKKADIKVTKPIHNKLKPCCPKTAVAACE